MPYAATMLIFFRRQSLLFSLHDADVAGIAAAAIFDV